MNRMNIITLGVKDMAQSIRFYRDGLGFKADDNDNEGLIVFKTSCTKLALYPLTLLAEDISEADPPKIAEGFSGITIAYNAKNETEVEEIIELARKAGAVIAKKPQKVFWGGYSGYFKDPNGYYWEVAHNPFRKFDENEMLVY